MTRSSGRNKGRSRCFQAVCSFLITGEAGSVEVGDTVSVVVAW